jgi:limonene 1,2-monooxygenase
MVAQRIVQLDHMTRGRVMFGAGPGSFIYDALMQDIDPTTTRDRMEEALEVVLRLFRGETVTKKTSWFSLKDAMLQLSPYSDPYPEVAVVSSKTPSGGRMAGRFGTGMICVLASSVEGFSVLDTNWKIAEDLAAEHKVTVKREQLRMVAPIHLADTRAQAEAEVRFGLEKFLDYNFAHTPRLRKRAEGMDPVEVVRKFRGGVIGTPDDAIELIKRLQSKGEFGCFLQSAHNWADLEATKRSYELYARFVMPHFRNANASRVASLEKLKSMPAEIAEAQSSAITKMFNKHNEEYAAKGKVATKYSEKMVS